MFPTVLLPLPVTYRIKLVIALLPPLGVGFTASYAAMVPICNENIMLVTYIWFSNIPYWYLLTCLLHRMSRRMPKTQMICTLKNAVAVILAFFVMGLGHIYLGKIRRGIMVLITGYILVIVGVFTRLLVYLFKLTITDIEKFLPFLIGNLIISLLSMSLSDFLLSFLFKGHLLIPIMLLFTPLSKFSHLSNPIFVALSLFWNWQFYEISKLVKGHRVRVFRFVFIFLIMFSLFIYSLNLGL